MLELDSVRLRVRDWPGRRGPLIHVPDPLGPSDSLLAELARLAPRYRVLSVAPRGDSPYQVDAIDLVGLLRQFGFVSPLLVAQGHGCVAALLVAAWHPERVAALVLVEAAQPAPAGESLVARALRECPPDWVSLREGLRCPVLVTSSVEAIEAFAAATLP
jgi:pimeloyl-ACP methyl ester carboxylesterase